MPYDFIYENDANEQYKFRVGLHADRKWYLKTSDGYIPVSPRLADLNAHYVGMAYVNTSGVPNAQSFELKPPEPTPEADAGDPTERRFGKWTIKSAVRHMRTLSSAGYDELRRTDEDFRLAIDSSDGLTVSVDTTPNPADTKPKYTTFAQLSTSEQAKKSWATTRSFSLVSDRNGVFREPGAFAIYGGRLQATCLACGAKDNYPLSAWIHGEAKCTHCDTDDYARDGRQLT